MNTETNQLPALISDAEMGIILSIPQALVINKETVDKAVAAGQKLLAAIEANGMNDEFDATCNAVLVKMRERTEEIWNRRSPATKLFDEVKSKFTEQEKRISPKAAGNIYSKLQDQRNIYATKKILAQQAKELEIKRKQDIENDKINLLAAAKIDLNRQFENYVLKAKSLLQNAFDSVTIASEADVKTYISSFSASYDPEHFKEISLDINSSLLKWEELVMIKEQAKAGEFVGFAYKFESQIEECRERILQQLPGKIQYLHDLEKAGVEKKKQMEAEEQQRKDAEAKRLEEQRLKAEAAAALKVESDKQAAISNNAFNNMAEVMENTSGTNAIENYEITVKKHTGWAQIFQFYMQNEGLTLDNDKLEKKSLGQMKAYAEKMRKKEVIIQSDYIEYNPVYKTQARKG